MVSFYPGPSRVDDGIPRWTAAAAKEGILSMNHRSPECMALVKATATTLRKKLDVPRNYTIFFVSSATECWEIIAQSLINEESLHLYNGAFGEKWYQYTRRLKPGARAVPFDRESLPAIEQMNPRKESVICLTQNETSNGTALPQPFIRAIRKRFARQLIAVDATSSMAGIHLDFAAADVWFASVQKCFGLPAGLAVMICSPMALKKAANLNESLHYNSLVFMKAMMDKWQTTHTPNVLGIYLLWRLLERRGSITTIDQQTRKRSDAWYSFFQAHASLSLLIQNPKVQSQTVIALTAPPVSLKKIKNTARAHGFLLGEGYGELKANTLRIANFPAIRPAEIRGLKRVLNSAI